MSAVLNLQNKCYLPPPPPPLKKHFGGGGGGGLQGFLPILWWGWGCFVVLKLNLLAQRRTPLGPDKLCVNHIFCCIPVCSHCTAVFGFFFLFLYNSIIFFVQILVCYFVMVIILFCTLFSFVRSNFASQTRLILSHFYTTYRFIKCGWLFSFSSCKCNVCFCCLGLHVNVV